MWLNDMIEGIFIKELNTKCIKVSDLNNHDLVMTKGLIVKLSIPPSSYRNCDKFITALYPEFYAVKFNGYVTYPTFDRKNNMFAFSYDLSGYSEELQLLYKQCNMSELTLTDKDYQQLWWLTNK